MIAAIDPSDPAPFADIPLLANRNMIDDQPTVYLCERHSCQMPANNPKSLSDQLLGMDIAEITDQDKKTKTEL